MKTFSKLENKIFGMCPTEGCIKKKSNGKWGIISNKTGKFWNANYDSEEEAHKGLEAYFVNKTFSSKDEMDLITIECNDTEGSLLKLLKCIQECGNAGHSFTIVVDPEEIENLDKRKFGWDGDGSDKIMNIESTKINSESKFKVGNMRMKMNW